MKLGPGSRLGHYQITALLGVGGMGEVYRATDPRLRRDVAIKVLPPEYAADSDRLRRFEAEALTAASLNHPGILAVYDIGLEDGTPYIVSELLEGSTLRQVLADGALPQRKATGYASQIARGLAAAHTKGIVHRDLKPENLLVTRDGRVKILDFGIAKLTDANASAASRANLATVAAPTQPGVIVGTPEYMAPEQIRGESVDHRTDIFALGLVLYEAVAGRRAFTGASAVETMSAILKEDPPALTLSNEPLSPLLDRTVRRCLEKNPDERFQSGNDLAFHLDTLPSDAGTALVAPAVTRRRARAWLTFAAAGLALVAAGAASGLSWARYTGRPSPTFKRLTFQRGIVDSARFGPDGETIVYSAAWLGTPTELFSTRRDAIDARSLGNVGARISSISPDGQMALRLPNGTLATAALAGGEPRQLIEHIVAAAWGPDGRTLAIVRDVGQRQRIEFPPGQVWYETTGNIGAIAVAPTGDLIACDEAPQGIQAVRSIGLVDRAGTHRTLSEGWTTVEGIAWPRDATDVWFAAATAERGAGTIFAVSTRGRLREVVRLPGHLSLYDVFPGGRALVGQINETTEARGLTPGDVAERDLSWFDKTGLSALSPDGRTMVITVFGDTGIHIYLRKTDGSPAVPLGEGGAFALSPDGRSLLTATVTPPQLVIMPIGPGEPRFIPRPGFNGFLWGNWFPDGKRVLIAGSEIGHGVRLYVDDLDGRPPRALTPEGTAIRTGNEAISPNGDVVAATDPSARIVLFPVDGSEPHALAGALPGESPSRWSADGRSLYVYRRRRPPVEVTRVDVATGQRELWKRIMPPDIAGVTGIAHVMLTPDGSFYVYNFGRRLTDLYLVEGLR